MNRKFLVLVAMAGLPLAAQTIVLKSSFDADAEGWSAIPLFQHRPSGGNPGGFLFMDNPETDPVVMVAPNKFHGDLRAFDGGVLGFDGNMLRRGAPPDNRFWRDDEAALYGGNYGTVTITGAGGLKARKDLEPGEPPVGSWKRYSAPFTAQTFGMTQTQWLSLLAGVTSITVSVEAIYGEEQQGFDNFTLTGSCPPSPRSAPATVYQSTCAPSRRPVPEEVVIEVDELDSLSGAVDVPVDGGPGFTETWKMATPSDKVIVPRRSGRAPSLVRVLAAPEARDGTVASLLWDFAGGQSYTTLVTILVRQRPARPPEPCDPQRQSGFFRWPLSGPPTTTFDTGIAIANTRPPTATQLPVYRYTKDPMGMPPGTYQGALLGQGQPLCDLYLEVPPVLPRIGLPPGVRFDVYSDDRSNLLQEIPIRNPSQTQTMRWRLKFSADQVPWVGLREESGVLGPGGAGNITVMVRPERLPTPDNTTYLIFAAEGFADTGLTVSAEKDPSTRPLEVTPLGLAITPQRTQTITIRNPGQIAVQLLVSTDILVGSDLGLTATPAVVTVPAEGSATVTVRMTNTQARAGSTGIVLIRDPVGGGIHQVVVTAVTQGTGVRSSEPVRAGLPGQGACRAVDLVPVFARPGVNPEVAVGLPVPVVVQVLDDCGEPVLQGQVTVEPANGDAAFYPVPRGDGYWFGAWTPLRESTGFFALRALAFSADGKLFGEFTMPVRVARNPAPPPAVETASIVNAASLAPNRPHAPGEFVSLFGVGLADRQEVATAFPLPTRLGGMSIQIGDVDTPLLFAGPGQVNAIVPFGLPTKSLQTVVLRRGASVSTPGSILIVDAQPGVFTLAQSGQGPGVIVDANFRLIGATNAARAGDVVIVFLTGLGETDPSVRTGAATPLSPLSRTRLPVTVTIGGRPAEVLFAGLAPGFAGLYQINAVVPAGVPTGAEVPLVVTAGGLSGPPVTMAVR